MLLVSFPLFFGWQSIQKSIGAPTSTSSFSDLTKTGNMACLITYMSLCYSSWEELECVVTNILVSYRNSWHMHYFDEDLHSNVRARKMVSCLLCHISSNRLQAVVPIRKFSFTLISNYLHSVQMKPGSTLYQDKC